MNGKLKALALALVATLALSAVVASAASAQFTSNKEHTIISGSQKEGTNDVFTTGEGFGGIACESVTFAGTATGTSEPEQTITPTYNGCKDSFGRTVHTDYGSLTYVFKPSTTTKTTNGTHHPTDLPEIIVTGGMTLTVTSGGSVVCTIVIKSGQTNTGITYTNLGGTSGIEVTTHSSDVISTTSGGFFNCGVANGEHKEGTYDGTAIVTGKDTSGAAASISVDEETRIVH